LTKDGVPGAAEVQAQMTAAVESVVDTCVQIAPWEELLKFARGWAAGTLDEGKDAAPAAATAEEVKTVSGQEQAASGQGVEKGGAASGQGVEKGGAGLAKNDHSQFVNAQKEYKEVMQGHGATFHLALTVLRCLEPRGASITEWWAKLLQFWSDHREQTVGDTPMLWPCASLGDLVELRGLVARLPADAQVSKISNLRPCSVDVSSRVPWM